MRVTSIVSLELNELIRHDTPFEPAIKILFGMITVACGDRPLKAALARAGVRLL